MGPLVCSKLIYW